MAGPNLRTSLVDGDTGRIADTNAVNGIANVFDENIGSATVGQTLIFNGSTFVPGTITGTSVATDMFAAFGDSLAAGGWVGNVGTDLGVSYADRAVAGTSSSDIAARQGGLQPALTISGNSIPTSGAVTVTSIVPATSWRTDGTGSFAWTGTLASIPGTLTHNMTAATWSFTRTSSGSATACPAGTPFIPNAGDSYRTWTQAFWAGRNNFGASTVADDVIRDVELMVRFCQTARYLVLGMTNSSTETSGTTNHIKIVNINSFLANRYGSKFIDIRRALIDDAMHVLGKTYTTTDSTDVGNDIIPTQLKSDTIHLTADGYTFVGMLVAHRIRENEYMVGKTPTTVPATPTGLTVGTITTSTIALSWSAAARASAYTLEYRIAGGTWQRGNGTTSTSTTISSLSSATDYEFRLTAYNIDGASLSAPTVTATTGGTGATYITSDSFNRSDTAAGSLGTSDAAYGGTGKAWTVTSQLQILSNRVGASTLTTTRWATVDTLVTDHWAEIVLAVTTDGGVVCRYADGNNHYRVRVSSAGQAFLEKRVTSTTTSLSSTATGAVVVNDRIALRVSGNNLTVYLNGVSILTSTQTDLTTQTRAGIQSAFSDTTARLDDFKCWNG